jgi:hypothetical protein
MIKSNIALVTTTLFNDLKGVRFLLALETIREAKKHGYQIYVVDASPNKNVRELFEKEGAVVELERIDSGGLRSMGASRRQCLRMGLDSGADIIVWLEPEKYTFVKLISLCTDIVGRYEIVLPGRKSLMSYPLYQELSELRAIRTIGIITGRPDIDWMFGPRIMTRKGAELMCSYTGDLGDMWQSFFIPVLWAIASGVGVGSRLVDYMHPPEQTKAEEGDSDLEVKRNYQRDVLEEVITAEVSRLGIKGLI